MTPAGAEAASDAPVEVFTINTPPQPVAILTGGSEVSDSLRVEKHHSRSLIQNKVERLGEQ